MMACKNTSAALLGGRYGCGKGVSGAGCGVLVVTLTQ